MSSKTPRNARKQTAPAAIPVDEVEVVATQPQPQPETDIVFAAIEPQPQPETEAPQWESNGLPKNDAAKVMVAAWQALYADAKNKWASWSQADKFAFATALAKRLESSFDGDMTDKRSLAGYIRLGYSEAAFRFTRNISCADNSLPIKLRQWIADMGSALRDSDSVALAALKPSDGSNPTYIAIGQFVGKRNQPTITIWPHGGGSRKLAGGGELKLT